MIDATSGVLVDPGFYTDNPPASTRIIAHRFTDEAATTLPNNTEKWLTTIPWPCTVLAFSVRFSGPGTFNSGDCTFVLNKNATTTLIGLALPDADTYGDAIDLETPLALVAGDKLYVEFPPNGAVVPSGCEVFVKVRLD